MIRRLGRISAIVLVASALALAGCGRKGDLQPPEGEKSAYKGLGVYPAPDSVVPQGGEPPTVPAPEAKPKSDEDGADGP